MSLCHKAVLNASDRIQELRKRIESYTSVKQDHKESFNNFLQRSTKAVQTGVTDPDARWDYLLISGFWKCQLKMQKDTWTFKG